MRRASRVDCTNCLLAANGNLTRNARSEKVRGPMRNGRHLRALAGSYPIRRTFKHAFCTLSCTLQHRKQAIVCKKWKWWKAVNCLFRLKLWNSRDSSGLPVSIRLNLTSCNPLRVADLDMIQPPGDQPGANHGNEHQSSGRRRRGRRRHRQRGRCTARPTDESTADARDPHRSGEQPEL